MLELDLLTAVSPIDGRYRTKAGALAEYLSVSIMRVSNHCVIFTVISQRLTLSVSKK